MAREGDRVAVTAQLIEAATETNLWADRYEREMSSILALQGEVAQAIAREIQVTLTPQEEALLTSSREVDPEAYEAYLKGMALLWAGLGLMGLAPPEVAVPKSKAATERALDLDDTVAEAHYARALNRTWGDWDWEGAEIAFRRAIELKPNWADVRAYYAHYLMITGRPEEAIAQMERALELDPYNLLVQALNGMVLESTDRCEEALDILERAFEGPHSAEMPYIGVAVEFISLRDEPRFQELLRRMNLPAS